MATMDPLMILVVDDEPLVLRSLTCFFKAEGHDAHGASTLAEAVEVIESVDLDLVLADVNLPDGTSFKLLDKIKGHSPAPELVLMTGYGTIDDAVQAIKSGAADYVTKPLVDGELRMVVEKARRRRELRTESAALRPVAGEESDFGAVVANDPAMKQVLETTQTVADTHSTVLLTGESGTGKTLLARALHCNSSRCDGPFVEVACGALDDSLLESELFGHEAGAFTGAYQTRRGKFEEAHGGTIFLDEIATASPAMQVGLLRVIDDGCIERVGGTDTIRVDVRIVLATNRDLAREVEAGRFREDLYYRINVLPIRLPALRERPNDIPALARHFVRTFARQATSSVQDIAPEAMEVLTAYRWPGNVRELEHIIERGVLLAEGDRIEMSNLPEEIVEEAGNARTVTVVPLKKAMEEPERRVILRALDRVGGNRDQAAELLGISRSTLFNKLRRLNINKAEARG